MNRLFSTICMGLYAFCLSAQNTPKYNPYTAEPLPETAPDWMREIAEHPLEVNFFRMDSLFNDWQAKNVDVRIKTRAHKPAVNFYRRWRKAYAPFVDRYGQINLPDWDTYSHISSRLGLRQSSYRNLNQGTWCRHLSAKLALT